MSVGDIKGSRRRFKILTRKGQAPKRPGHSTSEAIARERAFAARQAKSAAKK